MTRRTCCAVPGCKRTRGQRKGEPPIQLETEWICGDHWPLVPAFLRKRRARLARRYRRAFGDNPFWSYGAGTPNRIAAVKLDRMLRAAWVICKRAAIERAIGLR